MNGTTENPQERAKMLLANAQDSLSTQDTLAALKEYYEQRLLYAINAPASSCNIVFSYAAIYCRVLYTDDCSWWWGRRMEWIHFSWLGCIRGDCIRNRDVCS